MSGPEKQLTGIQDNGQNAAATTLHLIFRFLRTVRLRSGILVASLIVAGIAGAAYFITAVRMYESKAALLIVRKGSGVTEDATQAGGSPNVDMPTYVHLAKKDEIIQIAIKRLPEKFLKIDLGDYPQTQWIKLIQDNLSVSSAYSTNILDLSYQSRDPKAAAAMLTAVLASYVQFQNKSHRGSSEENLVHLRATLARHIQERDAMVDERLKLKASAPDLVDTGDKDNTLSVSSERIKQLSTEYTVAQRATENSKAKAVALQQAIARDENILQFAMETLDSAGKQLIEQYMGLSTQDAFHVQRITQELLDLQSENEDEQRKLGANHPKIRALLGQIAVKETYIQQYPIVQRQKMAEMARSELAPMLVQYINQQTQNNLQNEQSLGERLYAEQARAQVLSATLTRLNEIERGIEWHRTKIEEYRDRADGIDINKETGILTEIATRPTISTRPVSPRLAITGILSLMMGTVGGLLIIWASIQFGAVVRTSDLRYWWVYPGALLAAGGLFLVPTLRPHANERVGGAIWPGIITLAYVILLAISFVIGQGSGQSVGANPGRPGLEWPFWLIGGLALVLIGYILLFTLAKKNGPPTKLLLQLQGVGMLVIAFTLLAVIFFTQSRGPWIGGLAGLFVFFTVLLALAWRRTRAAGSPQASLWRNLLIGEVVLAIALGGFLVAFNLSNAPFFEQLRTVPYIGRMGKLLEVDDGTGKVRRLIWIGDEQAGGSVALIKSDPIRAIVGWGPESMFVAYNRFYPPSLANIESRGASPDRSHEAYLDELINKGVLGLASYLFVLISVIVLARRLILRSEDWSSQVLLTGCIAVVTAHMVEGFTGIPIVATLMLLWITIAITVMVGKLKGEYSLNARPLVDPTLAAEPTPEPEPRAAGRQNSQRRPSNRARGSGNSTGNNGSGGRGLASTRPARSSNAAAWLVYGLIAIGALAAVWSFNIDNVYADMRFQQGQTYTEDPQADLDRYIIGTSFYLDSVRMEPNQDFYYLNLGRSLMSIVDIRRQTSGVALGQPDPEVRVEDLLRLQEPTDVQSFVLQQSPMMLMSYAEAVLNRAHTINPLNKDHFANLARMYNFWYSRLQRDPAILAKAVDWYKRGVEVAPQDVTILNEYASATALQGNDARSRGDEATANERLAEAARLLARSQQIDPLYRDTPVRAAEILRLQGRYAEAVDNYIVLLAQNPRALDNQIATIIDSLRSKPELLLKLRSAYDAAIQRKPDDVGSIALVGLISARAGDLPRAAQAFTDVVRLQPNNLEARQNYTLVLSDMLQYRQAAGEAEVLLRLAQQQGATQQEQSALESLLGFMRQKVSGQ